MMVMLVMVIVVKKQACSKRRDLLCKVIPNIVLFGMRQMDVLFGVV